MRESRRGGCLRLSRRLNCILRLQGLTGVRLEQ